MVCYDAAGDVETQWESGSHVQQVTHTQKTKQKRDYLPHKRATSIKLGGNDASSSPAAAAKRLTDSFTDIRAYQ